MLPERIYLVGMPASGKSTVGKALANQLQFAFYDTDEEIEKREQLTIPEIFAQRDEDYFRKVEKEVLESLLPQKAIIATGGGVPCFFDNMDFIRANGFSIFLNTNLEILAQRALGQDLASRPLLSNFDETQIYQGLEEKLEKRIGFYKQADLIVSIDSNQQLNSLIQIIVKDLEGRS